MHSAILSKSLGRAAIRGSRPTATALPRTGTQKLPTSAAAAAAFPPTARRSYSQEVKPTGKQVRSAGTLLEVVASHTNGFGFHCSQEHRSSSGPQVLSLLLDWWVADMLLTAISWLIMCVGRCSVSATLGVLRFHCIQVALNFSSLMD